MKRRQAFKFALQPTKAQQHLMRCFAGSCRFVFNHARALQHARFEQGEKKLRYSELCAVLTTWKMEPSRAWLAKMPSQALQQALKDLERAFDHFFAQRAAYPRKKKKTRDQAFRYPQGTTLDETHRRIFLPKLGWVRYRKSRAVEGVIKNVTIRYEGTRWTVAIQTEREVAAPMPSTDGVIGIDVGIRQFATLSDGQVFEPLQALKRDLPRLKRAQRAVNRKQKMSRNRQKAQLRVRKLHTRIRHCRQNYLHQLTTTLSKNHAIVCVEHLQVKNLSASAAGTREAPGKHVKAKSGLNRTILDQGWFEFRRQLDYKLRWRGGQLVLVPPAYTSQRCLACGHVAAANRPSQACFACVACHFQAPADWVGACNVLRAGLAQLACGERRRFAPSMKQEPAEVRQAIR